MDQRILRNERDADGKCSSCSRRHIHTDGCPHLRRRERYHNEGMNPDRPVPYAGDHLGTDPDEPMIPYAGGIQD